METVSGKYTIKQIFKDHWSEYLKKYPQVPEYVKKEVRKVLNCRNPNKGGYLKYACPNHPWECMEKDRSFNLQGLRQRNDFKRTGFLFCCV